MNNQISSVSHMMRRALNTLNHKLMDHGERIAYLLLCMFKAENYTVEQLTKICYLGIFHDIGAYQLQTHNTLLDSQNPVAFEVADPIPHSVYSYLFLNEHEFFEEFADAILFHHFTYEKLLAEKCENKVLASRMFVLDKLDIMIMRGMVKTADDAISKLDNAVFCKEDVEFLLQLEKEQGIITKCLDGRYLDELLDFLVHNKNYGNYIESLIHMLPHAIDFRSEHTVTHTIATVEISVTLAKLLGMSENEISDIYFGALLHDIGKISVSTMLLEKTGKLTDNEFRIMQDHILLSEYILKDCVSPEIFKIATRHHEKLDGTGYPFNLKGEELNLSERIVAVADVLSALLGKRSYKEPFSEDRVRDIMGDLSDKNKLCKTVIDIALENYELIHQVVYKCSEDAHKKYENLKKCADELIEKYQNI